MKHLIYISIFFLSFVKLNAQEGKDLYIWLENSKFTYDVLGYKAYFGLESQEKDFRADIYFFRISFPDLDNHTLFDLGKVVNKNSIEVIYPSSHFKNKSFCELHLELSSYKRIFIVTPYPKKHMKRGESYEDKLVIWYSNYSGSVKDITFMNNRHSELIDH